MSGSNRMVTRWTRKIVAFLHDPPGKALVLRSVPHTRHEQLAEALQRIALGRPATADEKDRATKADHIASAADRVNFPAGATAYWDQVSPTLTHPLSAEAQAATCATTCSKSSVAGWRSAGGSWSAHPPAMGESVNRTIPTKRNACTSTSGGFCTRSWPGRQASRAGCVFCRRIPASRTIP
jgi:hypothetical protein